MAKAKKSVGRPARKPVAGKKKNTAKPKSKKTAVKNAKTGKNVRLPTPVKAGKKRQAGVPEAMRDAALKILDERQAEDIVTVDLAGRSSLGDYLIIASGRSSRQVAAMADYLRDAFMKLGIKHVRLEGVSEGNWVLVDAGDIVVHLFRPEVRRYYDLENIWDNKDIKRSALLIE